MLNFNIIYSDIYNIDHYVFGMDGSNGDYCRSTSADTKIDLNDLQCALKSKKTISSLKKSLLPFLQN